MLNDSKIKTEIDKTVNLSCEIIRKTIHILNKKNYSVLNHNVILWKRTNNFYDYVLCVAFKSDYVEKHIEKHIFKYGCKACHLLPKNFVYNKKWNILLERHSFKIGSLKENLDNALYGTQNYQNLYKWAIELPEIKQTDYKIFKNKINRDIIGDFIKDYEENGVEFINLK